MPRSVLNAADSGLAQRLVDLQQCPLFQDLTLEQLHLFARACATRSVSQQQARKPLSDLAGKVVFIAEGQYDAIYLPDDQSWEDVEAPLELQRLQSGDLWGEHHLVNTDPTKVGCLGLRAASHGRLLMLSAVRLRHYLDLWPVLRARFFAEVAQRALDRQLELARLRDVQAGTDLVLDRIDSVAEVLLSGDTATSTHQRKYVLKTMPTLKGRIASQERLEQGYLDGSKTREDRFRCRLDLVETDPKRYMRTSRFGSGASRRDFVRRINAEEYQKMKRRAPGLLIGKCRYKLKHDVAGTELRLDEFSGAGNLAGLVLLEAEFTSAAEAETFVLPSWLKSSVVEEVTENAAYGNRSLALYGRPAG